MQACRNPSTVQLVKRLEYSNLLGLDVNLKREGQFATLYIVQGVGAKTQISISFKNLLKEGTLNWEILQFKSMFPREVLLCRVGNFYEALGIDACILVEYAGLNPFGGLRSDSTPRAGCPVVRPKAATLIWDLNSRQSMGHLNEFTFDLFFFILDCIFNS
ncbi:hypothetical protein FNV43_RR00186 [Rhamnella rubrinervis]|uniref:MutS-like protein n=1 Tax=Rhamnella rubrinervis TaxID=2594499 RepID=A0A8K0MRN8_9ROSA|nr:hypothetical protein FNV43_RR00186 [Rhamnella rubrinervis]